MRHLRLLLPVTLALVVVADLCLWRAPSGWTLSALLCLLTVGAAVRWRPALDHLPGRLALGLAALSELALFLEPGWLGLWLALLGLMALAPLSRPHPLVSPLAWLRRLALALALMPFRLIPDWLAVRRSARRRAARGTGAPGWSVRRLAMLWGLPLAGTLVFALLFAWANPVWEKWLSQAWDQMLELLNFKFPEWLSPGRLLFWGVMAACVWGFWRNRAGVARPREAPRQERFLAPDLVIRCLILFTALFAMQLALDSRYLLLGAELPAGMNHAAYAHRGAYPLMLTAILAGGFTLIAFHPQGPARHSPWARRLIGAFIAENILLLLSAAWRLFLYMDAFGLTRWRLAAAVWMLLVGGGLALILAMVLCHKDTLWLRWKVALMALPVLLACAFFPVDRVICGWNATHHPEALTYNLRYMESLGVEALPGLREAARLLRAKGDHATALCAEGACRRLENTLHALRQDPRAWTPRRALLELPENFDPNPNDGAAFTWHLGGLFSVGGTQVRDGDPVNPDEEKMRGYRGK